MDNIENMDLRTLQKETARATHKWRPTVSAYHQFNSGLQDSRLFFINTLKEYVEKFGDLPSKIGPGKDVVLLYENS